MPPSSLSSRTTDVLYHAVRRTSYMSSHHDPRDLLAVLDLALRGSERGEAEWMSARVDEQRLLSWAGLSV